MLKKFLVIVLSIFLLTPFIVKAESYTSYNRNIKNIEKFAVGDLYIDELEFNDFSYTLSYSYGLYGKIKNISTKTYTLSILVEYYSSKGVLISSLTREFNILPNMESDLNLMQGANEILEGQKAQEIEYYDMKIYTSEIDALNKPYSRPSLDPKYKDESYIIDEYEVKIDVNEDNTFDVQEKIVVFYNTKNHGITKKIPLSNEFYKDGKKIKNRVQITDIEVDSPHKEENKNGYKILKIGEANSTLTGSYTYNIKYTYNVGRDNLDDEDQFYFDLVGSEWDAYIGNIKFKVNMPLEYDHSKIDFLNISTGSVQSSKIKYSLEGKTIEGSYEGVLPKNNTISLRIGLDEGYFAKAGFSTPKYVFLLYLVPILCMISSVIIWFIYGRDEEVKETIEFYPPKGLNSLEVGFMYRGKCEDIDAISLLVYLATKGYIKLEYIKEKDEYILYKLKEYDEKNELEEMFLKGLFKRKTIANGKTFVKSEDIKNDFREIVDRIKNKKNGEKNRYFVGGEKIRKFVISVLMFLTLFVEVVIPFINYDLSYRVSNILISLLIIVGLLTPLIRIFMNSSHGFDRVLCIFIFILVFLGINSFIPLYQILASENVYIRAYITSILCILVMGVCYIAMPKRTHNSSIVLGQIKGFKRFIETAKEEKLITLIKKNPSYCFDLLPFAYVLGATDKWIKKFEGIVKTQPDWYINSGKFNVRTIGDSIESITDSIIDDD